MRYVQSLDAGTERHEVNKDILKMSWIENHENLRNKRKAMGCYRELLRSPTAEPNSREVNLSLLTKGRGQIFVISLQLLRF